ncbi:NAD(P)-binding protein [Tabrizicola sp.]|uniref:NAD(P)-binding protein n=1 Tax=Tabrizicola sp. TaxID=2005166 RepID=UPI00260FE637|nr:NAD(P)-binding protein [Tabrizicola sp.]MDM7933648.1 NAD(P)-binding protein [Tabrizicola sp.]
MLILGGGLAECAAALALADRSHAATIVEARDRLGGTAFSRTLPGDDGSPVEIWRRLGQPHHHRVQVLAARLGMGLTPRASAGFVSTKPAEAHNATTSTQSDSEYSFNIRRPSS